MSNPFELRHGASAIPAVRVWEEFNEAALRGGDHSLRPIQNLELTKDVLDMNFHSVFSDFQGSDLRKNLAVPVL